MSPSDILAAVTGPATVLVVDDEPDIVDILEFNLSREGHRVVTAHNGIDALKRATVEPRPDLVVLDLMLPDISGKEVCRRLRGDARTARIPILMLTAKGSETDRVVGFEIGTDDYVTKPFSIREVVLRVSALLRRATDDVVDSDDTEQGLHLKHGGLEIDEASHRVWVDGEERTLTALEFKLLLTLARRAGRVQSREKLLDDVWEMSAGVTTRTVDTHMTRLRKKLGSASTFIETIRGVGYRYLDAEQRRDTRT